MTDVARSSRPAAGSLLYNKTARAIVYQIVLLASIGALGWWLVSNTLQNLAEQDIATGFDFLVDRQAGFAISESMIPYSETDTYLRAFVVGLLNTVKVAVTGIILATILGTIIGIARLSHNWLIRKLASGYVETVRNIPLLLQLIFWYTLLTEVLPDIFDKTDRTVVTVIEPLPGVFLSNRGLMAPAPVDAPGWWFILIGLALSVPAVILFRQKARAHQDRTGRAWPAGWISLGIVVGLALIGWLAGGAPTEFSVPELGRFNIRGGLWVSPEFIALLLGLTLYTAGFIAEIVRSGILAISHGQTEASQALGFSRAKILRLIILPQALRVIIPPMTSQFLNLTKNSSLAIAIGYPDLVFSMNVSLNQTGQAIECIAIAMSVYLIVSLGISFFMNWYNARVALRER